MLEGQRHESKSTIALRLFTRSPRRRARAIYPARRARDCRPARASKNPLRIGEARGGGRASPKKFLSGVAAAHANLTCRLAAFVRAGTEHGQQRARFVSAALPQSKGGYYAFQAFGHCHRGYCNDGRRACVGSKQHGRKDARPHHAKDAAGEEHRTGSIRICARSPQAEVQVTISISIHAESQNYPDYNWHARPLKALIMQLRAARN